MADIRYRFGMVGLGVMGRNFLLNIADKGFSVIGLDNDPEKAKSLEQEAASGQQVKGTTSAETFVSSLEAPRIIMLLVPAGDPVDAVINQLQPLLGEGDLLVDGGNSHFLDTERREKALREKNLNFLGMGVSGGEEGARRGPSIMPGGAVEAYPRIKPVLEAVAAKVDGEPCVTYLGPRSAGHYVKMVHNGIEYGLMQLISEIYDLLKRSAGLDNDALANTFDQWNEGKLKSFLIEITALIFRKRDDDPARWLIDNILDKGKQKGTGKWTSQHALDLGVPIPTIDAAVTMRQLSALKEERQAAADKLPPTGKNGELPNVPHFVKLAEDALYAAFIITYAQGMAQLQASSRELDYGLNFEAIARIWRGGCIIRAALLEPIRQAYSHDPGLSNLMVAPHIAGELAAHQDALREVVRTGTLYGIPTAALSASLHYFDAYRSERLPLNLVQAQRDFFGAHTYERTDREGVFHTKWG